MTTTLAVAGGHVEVRASSVSDGDFHLDLEPDVLDATRQRFLPGSWSMPDEVHGTTIARVDRPGGGDRVVADGLVTDLFDEILGVWVGDCAPIALVADGGTIAGVHAGWRGLRDGVVEAAVTAMGGCRRAVLGPCIRACCYEFGATDLATMTARFGRGVAATTTWGTPALDVPAAVAVALADHGVDLIDIGRCTGCHPAMYFSHRIRAQRQRQVLAVVKRAAA